MKTLQHGLMLTPWKEGWQTGQPDEVIVGREKGAPRLFFQLVPGKNAVCFRSIIADRRFYPPPLPAIASGDCPGCEARRVPLRRRGRKTYRARTV